jgi:hypothetical protein
MPDTHTLAHAREVLEDVEVWEGDIHDKISDADLITELADVVRSLLDVRTHKRTEYRVTFQRSPVNNDPRGTIELTGLNFPDLVQHAKELGYPRVIGGDERTITPWAPIEDYEWDEPNE